MKFGEKLKKRRQELHLTQEYVAEKIGISRRAYVAYEQNDVRPRKQETYQKLADVLECDVGYLKSDDGIPAAALLAAGISFMSTGLALGSPIGALAAIPLTTTLVSSWLKRELENRRASDEALEYTEGLLAQYKREQRRFQAMAMGVIISELAEKGVSCQPEKPGECDEVGAKPDESLIIKDSGIERWWFSFYTAREADDEHRAELIRNQAHMLFSRFATALPDPKRKTSIIVDDPGIFDELCRFKGHNSYRGNMSAILIDPDEAKVVKEEQLAFFDEDSEADGLAELKLTQ